MMNTIALELQRIEEETINTLAPVIFDKLILQRGEIEYDSITGEIKINKVGRYAINWALTSQAFIGNTDVRFGIKVDDRSSILTSSPVKLGEVVGFGIIQISRVPATVTLINEVNNPIQLTRISKIKAHLMLSELLENDVGATGPTGPTGPAGPVGVWQGGGMQLLSNNPLPGQEITILPGEVIPFDNVTFEAGGVTYSQETIQIMEPGYYMVSWEILVKPAQPGDILLTLEDTTSLHQVYGKIGSKGQAYTTLSAVAFLSVSNVVAPYAFELQIINRSSVPIQLTAVGSLPVIASRSFSSTLTVVKTGDLYWS